MTGLRLNFMRFLWSARPGKPVAGRRTFIADQRGAVAIEGLFVYSLMMFTLLLPLADVAIAGFKYISAYQALRDMGQYTQYSPPPDATDATSITTWQNSLPATVSGYTVSAAVKCGNAGTAAPCVGTDFPKYYTFQTSFTLSPLVLGSAFCSTCTVNYSQRFQ
ncbi:hypothetical protein JQ617_37995 [Bradyrhizobium sp. KB893862 SZCCT0404]|uniref:hypothetical protein n=1 Tax=Bradyrhizobium sp. KB893862 SZCCT0404 TaxID=2807672 RepID=UPI001BA8E2D4|nr:hypothetical protein [Bradyrhizobium sp. KB893862 SZCCT0404]MBR1179811.1 hypothetical protein [Bradyrhizobium sp. KB893862 SZCCT0404]